MVTGFPEFRLATRIVTGVGALRSIGELASGIQGLDARRVLIVTDPGVLAAGYPGRAQQLLTEAGWTVRIHDAVRENPSTADVDACLAVGREFAPTLLIGLGGGSSMDVAKGCNFVLTNGGRMQDYRGYGKARVPMLPLIAVPTTAGTGSELQSFALIADEETHQKMACGSPYAVARVAVLDPELTLTQPRTVTACTGLDAIGHAVETAVTKTRKPLSALFSRESFRLAAANFPRVLRDPGDLEARGDMQLAAAYAGVAIENSMLGAAHAMANPLTAGFDIAHGQAVGMSLPLVVRFNAEDPEARARYAELAAAAGLEASAEALADRLTELLAEAGLPTSLTGCGIPTGAAATMAQEAAQQWTAQHNPRPVSADQFRALYESAF